MPDQSCTLLSAADAEAVIGEAEAIARDAARKEQAKARRKALQAGKARQRKTGQDQRAADQRERGQARKAEKERLRAGADKARAVLLERAAQLRELAGGSLRDCFEGLDEPRDPRGIRHPLPAVLALVVMAMLSGKVTLVAIGAWIANADQRALEMAGARHRGKDGLLSAPSPKTVTRVLALAGPQPLSDAVGAFLAAAVPAWPAGEAGEQAGEQQEGEQEREEGQQAEEQAEPPARPHLQCDGKEVRGARRPDGTSMFILSAATGRVVVADREIPAKTN